jgi:hypothetical protein
VYVVAAIANTIENCWMDVEHKHRSDVLPEVEQQQLQRGTKRYVCQDNIS